MLFLFVAGTTSVCSYLFWLFFLVLSSWWVSSTLSVTHLCFSSSLPQTTFVQTEGDQTSLKILLTHILSPVTILTEASLSCTRISHFFFFCHLILKFVAWICNHIIVYLVWVSCFCYCSFCWFLHNFCRGRVYELAFKNFSPLLLLFFLKIFMIIWAAFDLTKVLAKIWGHKLNNSWVSPRMSQGNVVSGKDIDWILISALPLPSCASSQAQWLRAVLNLIQPHCFTCKVANLLPVK